MHTPGSGRSVGEFVIPLVDDVCVCFEKTFDTRERLLVKTFSCRAQEQGRSVAHPQAEITDGHLAQCFFVSNDLINRRLSLDNFSDLASFWPMRRLRTSQDVHCAADVDEHSLRINV